jgi:Flp pilus assembly protein TadG
VLISVFLVMLLFGVAQVALYFYARNVAAAAAADGARYAAAEGIDPTAGAARAGTLIRAGLDGTDARALRCTSGLDRDPASGLTVVVVRCAGRLRARLLPLPVPLDITVSSSVLREG